jgi:SAM-dependent MidA family methyltransferase
MRGLQPIFPRNASVRVELPEPSPPQRAHSEHLAALIRAEIDAAGGAIDFARYMELALYAPGLGYYSAGATKFGVPGDFVTAPELGSVFARCLARALAPVLRETQGDLLELGPGSGALAADMLLELRRLQALPRTYRLLERSADLRERQAATLQQRCPDLIDRCVWLDEPPTATWRGTLVANEVVDALPVQAFALRDEGLFVRTVGLDESGRFCWRESTADAATSARIEHAIGGRGLPRPYQSEICTMLPAWFSAVTRTFEHGDAWFVDYGHDRAAYYSPARHDGTLRCHYRHRAHADPLILPGLQDITAWVDFDALLEAGAAAGFEPIVQQSQAQFLIAHGLDEVFADEYAQARDEAARYRLAQQVKRLTLPGEMGDAFRVVGLRRRTEGNPPAV